MPCDLTDEQTIAWANVDPDLCQDLALRGYNGLKQDMTVSGYSTRRVIHPISYSITQYIF